MVFTESWLREHEAKIAQQRDHQPTRLELVEFRLTKPFLLLNDINKMMWTQGGQRKFISYKRDLARQISASIIFPPVLEPMNKSLVTITRFSCGTPDDDGLRGGAKQLIDCLLVKSSVHPNGLGICVDDSPIHMVQDIRAERVNRRIAQRTEVRIERIG